MRQASQQQPDQSRGPQCSCGMCQAYRRSQLHGGIDWWLLKVSRWWDRRNRHAIETTTLDRKLIPDDRGLCQCPRCRELLHPDGTATSEQAQLKLEAMT